MKEPCYLKNFETISGTVITKITYNSFWENWQFLINGKFYGNFEDEKIAKEKRDKMFTGIISIHKFYRGKISKTFDDKILVIAENKKKLYTNTFIKAKEFALINQLNSQFELLL